MRKRVGPRLSKHDVRTLRDRDARGRCRLISAKHVLSASTEKHELQIVKTSDFGHILILDGELQLAEADQEIYHTLLVEPPMKAATQTYGSQLDVLILGGGDGFALRKVLEHENVRRVTLVDHDRGVIDLFCDRALETIFPTRGAFFDPKVEICISDARKFIKKFAEKWWHVIIIDLTDDWIDSSVDVLRGLSQHKSAVKGTFISMNAGSGLADRAPCVDAARSVGLVPICSWKFPMASYGEPWRSALCTTTNCHYSASVKRTLPRKFRESL